MENGNNALQVKGNGSDWQSMREQATMLVKSGFLPVAINTPEKAVAIALTAKEIGIGMMEGFRSINVIQGKPTVSPQLMLALANRTGQVEDIKITHGEDFCEITIKRKGRTSYTCSFGVADATAMQLMGKDNYKKQAKTMFQWRALAANLRVTFPDVVLGLYTPEEMGAAVTVGENEEMVIKAPEIVQVAHNPGVTDETPKTAATLPETKPLPGSGAPENVVVNVEEVRSTEYSPGKFRYGIKTDEGDWFTTFSSTDFNTAEECRIKGQKVDILFRTKMYKGKLMCNVEGLRPYDSQLVKEETFNG